MIVIISALTPFFVSLLTLWVKKLKTIAFSAHKKIILRFIVAIFSFAAVIGTAALSGGDVDPLTLETFAQAFATFVTALGIYWVGKKKG